MALPDWARAHGVALFPASIRSCPEEFDVTEILGWPLSGHGEHDYLWIEKRDANTEWVARQLARHAGVAARDIGYAGLKDRHALTRQWFSVPRRQAPDWSALEVAGVQIQEVARHHKKLRRGAHRGNAFRIVLRGRQPAGCAPELEARIDLIREQGVPNYFGEQRFGRGGANLRLADQWAAGKRMPRHSRSLAISTVRSFLFNERLDRRVSDGTWNTLLPGDCANLDGSGSVFEVPQVDEALAERCRAMDIHPAGILPGAGSGLGPDAWQQALERAGVDAATRALRLRVAGLECEVASQGATVAFRLGRGAYATAVLREICTT